MASISPLSFKRSVIFNTAFLSSFGFTADKSFLIATVDT